MLPDTLFIKSIDLELRTQITECQEKDQIILDALEALRTQGTPPMKSSLSDWRTDNGLIFYKNRCYIPPDKELRREITYRHHDLLSMGHPGTQRMLEILRRDYYWPGMATFVRNYVDGCATCQQCKINWHPSAPALMPIKGAD